ncbi:MAG TPA: hypothetical protein PJ988_13210 [Anaerolinea sp.]|nr:hypothetical protein [Anaerolinea sp.]
MNLDIQTGILVATIMAVLTGLIALLSGVQSIRSGKNLSYFRKRRERLTRGWRLVGLFIFLWIVALAINLFAEPVAYHYFPPSPTITLTPTVTLTPTITVTPTITLTPTITDTPSITNTPSMPIALETQFESTITPNPDAIFSPLNFARSLDKDFQPVDPGVEFANPITRMFAVFSYDQMTVGAQWSALWYRGDQLVCYETLPWNGGTGGFGYSECDTPVDGWQPGEYEVQIFIGTIWKNSGRFTVTGEAPTPIPSATPTRTPIPTATIGPSPTVPSATPTLTPTSTITPTITRTPTPTNTLKPTDTRRPTATELPTEKP